MKEKEPLSCAMLRKIFRSAIPSATEGLGIYSVPWPESPGKLHPSKNALQTFLRFMTLNDFCRIYAFPLSWKYFKRKKLVL